MKPGVRDLLSGNWILARPYGFINAEVLLALPRHPRPSASQPLSVPLSLESPLILDSRRCIEDNHRHREYILLTQRVYWKTLSYHLVAAAVVFLLRRAAAPCRGTGQNSLRMGATGQLLPPPPSAGTLRCASVLITRCDEGATCM